MIIQLGKEPGSVADGKGYGLASPELQETQMGQPT